MAPEYPPKLVVWDLQFRDGLLQGALDYVELSDNRERLRVRWGVADEPPGFFSVGGGVAYVYKTGSVVMLPISKEARPEALGNSRYRLQEGLPPNDPWLMAIVILPEGFTLVEPQPAPVSAKEFKGRLAMYWILKGDEFGRTRAEWSLKRIENDLGDEVEQINRSYSLGQIPQAANFELDKVTITQSTVNIFTDSSKQVNQSGGISLDSEGDTTIGGSVIGRDSISNSSS